jgi:phospholipid/cholesterol/gamma-HCH transport system permease protein
MAQAANIATIINTNKRQKIVPLHAISFKTGLNMFITESIKTFGSYLMMMKRVLTKPERWGMFLRRTLHEIYQLGINSIPIVLIISLFIGAALCIQMKTNVESPWMPKFVTGYATREVLLLEFSSTIMCLILAGKVGSNITSEIGAMRVTQQIDALEMMGVNSANFLILPKITGLMFTIPILVIFSIAAGIGGAFMIGVLTGIMTAEELTVGLQHEFTAWFIGYSIIKSFFFAFIITSVASFYGYNVKGGSIEVGKASTNAVVSCSALILFADIVLTNIMMQ